MGGDKGELRLLSTGFPFGICMYYSTPCLCAPYLIKIDLESGGNSSPLSCRISSHFASFCNLSLKMESAVWRGGGNSWAHTSWINQFTTTAKAATTLAWKINHFLSTCMFCLRKKSRPQRKSLILCGACCHKGGLRRIFSPEIDEDGSTSKYNREMIHTAVAWEASWQPNKLWLWEINLIVSFSFTAWT